MLFLPMENLFAILWAFADEMGLEYRWRCLMVYEDIYRRGDW